MARRVTGCQTVEPGFPAKSNLGLFHCGVSMRQTTPMAAQYTPLLDGATLIVRQSDDVLRKLGITGMEGSDRFAQAGEPDYSRRGPVRVFPAIKSLALRLWFRPSRLVVPIISIPEPRP